MKRSSIALLAACIVGTASVGVAANSPHTAHTMEMRYGGTMHRHLWGGEPPLARLVQQLDLSDAQRQSIRSLLESAKPQHAALRKQQREAIKEAMNTLPDDPNYPAVVQKRKDLAAAAIQQRSDLNVQIYALLTPEQKAEVPALIEKMKARAKHWRAAKRDREKTQL